MSATPRAGKATIPDVARRAGVGVATAGRALGGYGKVSAATRERVLAAAAELGYQRNELARTLVTGRSQTIGLIVADIDNPFFAALARGVGEAARDAGYQVVLAATNEDLTLEESAVELMAAKRMDGLIVAPASPDSGAHLQRSADGQRPVVLVDRTVDGVTTDAVVIDNTRAVRDVVDHLVGHGHRRIAMVTGGAPSSAESDAGRPVLSTGRERVDSFLTALRDAGVADPAAYLRPGAHGIEEATRLTHELLALPEPPTALFTSDSLVAIGALAAIRERGVAVPRELSFVTFDDAPWTSVFNPPLTVVSQPVEELGRRAMDVLARRLDGDEGDRGRHVLQASLVSRESVTAPGA